MRRYISQSIEKRTNYLIVLRAIKTSKKSNDIFDRQDIKNLSLRPLSNIFGWTQFCPNILNFLWGLMIEIFYKFSVNFEYWGMYMKHLIIYFDTYYGTYTILEISWFRLYDNYLLYKTLLCVAYQRCNKVIFVS